MITVAKALSRARVDLDESDTPGLDAEILLATVLGHSRAWLHTWPEAELDTAARERFERLIDRRAAGEPVAYLTGTRGFHDIDIEVSPDVLIPRPETEALVEFALTVIDQPEMSMLDAGSGSGCIALAVARARPALQVTATDNSRQALALARNNAERLGISGIEWLQGSWYEPLAGRRFDLIVSNPPYVATHDPHLQQGDVRFEPQIALVGGDDGLDAIRELAAGASAHLHPGGWIAIEHGADQGEAVRALLRNGGLEDVATHADLAGLPRFTTGRRPGGLRKV